MTNATPSDQLLSELKRLHPLLIDLSLDRIAGLLDELGRPHDRLAPVIHVAGTNGKGSVVAFLSAVLQAAGLRVHTYTSPHLVRFHERIGLAGPDGGTRPIDEPGLVALLSRVAEVNAGRPMTFFEITTAAALLAFAETPADAVILEVGLGGRLDATNVVAKPSVTVITPVSLDHMDKLGDTVSQIASEKAGILKSGVPCVVAPQHEDAFASIESAAARLRAPLFVWGKDFDAYMQNGRLVYQDEQRLMDLPLPSLRGPHQRINAGVAIAAARRFAASHPLGHRITESAIAKGMTSVSWPARMMPITSGPLRATLGGDDELWLDGGHNPAAGRVIADAIADLEDVSPKPTFVICGMSSNKDARGFIEPLAGLVRELVAVPVKMAEDFGAPPEKTAELAAETGIPAIVAASLEDAMRRVHKAHAAPKRVVICGSLFLAGEVLARQGAVLER